MSYTIIYKVPESGELQVAAEIPNAWRGAMNIWQAMYEKYLYVPGFSSTFGKVFMRQKMDPLWDLPKQGSVNVPEKIVLLTTFDRVMVPRDHLRFVIQAMQSWKLEQGSLPEQIKVLSALETDVSCFAVCWNQTSVTDAWWVPDGDDSRLYDLSRDNNHWWLFDHPGIPKVDGKPFWIEIKV